MVIAVDTRLNQEDYQNFIYKTFSRIIKKYSQHTFLFLFNKEYYPSFLFSEKIIPLVIEELKIPLLTQLVTDKKVLSLLKKYKADVYITSKCLLQTKISQCLIFNKNLPIKNVRKANLIITSSQFSKRNIMDTYNVNEGKINVVYPGIDEIFKPVNFEEREKIKEKYTDGNEYFLDTTEINSANNFFILLKAFSVFKKRQKSSMQLVIAVKNKLSPEFLELLRLFKFKTDVKILSNITKDESANITAGAYAIISLSIDEHFISHSLAAMKSNVPVIVSDKIGIREISGEAALYVNPSDQKDIAEKMMLIFKDEKLRSELIGKGKEQLKKYDWDIAAAQLWMSIEKATA